MMRTSIPRQAITALMLAVVASAQITERIDKKFEVVSVKPASAGSIPGVCSFSQSSFSSPVELSIDHCPLARLIEYALSSFGGPIAGVPGWADSALYSISAKAASPVSIMEKYAMLQPVMEERFQLKWHRETRQLPVYYLSAAGAIKLQKTVPGSCRAWDPNVGPPNPDPEQPPVCAVWMNRTLPDGGRTIEGNGITLAQLASTVGSVLGRRGLDSTGSKDLFDVHLEFANPDIGNAGDGTAGPSALPGAKKSPPTAPGPSEHQSIFSALKEVGLTVKAGRGPVAVLVVDSVQRASEN